MNLRLPNNVPRNAPWVRGLVDCLSSMPDYGLGEVEMIKAKWIGREIVSGKIPRWQQACVLEVNGRYVYLDCW